jgi:SAM-dependent methyltransferase
MQNVDPFEAHAAAYDTWFDAHRHAYASELEALRVLLPEEGAGVEIGVGTGRFAAALGVRHGVEPAQAMRRAAQARGIEVVDAVAEALPYLAETFDFALMVTTVCFLDDVEAAFCEAERVLKPGGALVVGLIDPTSPLGRAYEQRKADSVFYRGARFRSVDEVAALMAAAGFEDLTFRQTLFGDPAAMEAPDPVLEGQGEGAFVVIRGSKR